MSLWQEGHSMTMTRLSKYKKVRIAGTNANRAATRGLQNTISKKQSGIKITMPQPKFINGPHQKAFRASSGVQACMFIFDAIV
jgi:hypothetical protein